MVAKVIASIYDFNGPPVAPRRKSLSLSNMTSPVGCLKVGRGVAPQRRDAVYRFLANDKRPRELFELAVTDVFFSYLFANSCGAGRDDLLLDTFARVSNFVSIDSF